MQGLLKRGAACVLEGLDILEPPINALMASLDCAHRCNFSNAVVFFSQRGNEGYRGHFDTDDVLVVRLAGVKKWRLHRRVPARRTNNFDLPESEMGPLEAEVVMRAGDVMFVRSGTPHRVETADDYREAFDAAFSAWGSCKVLRRLLRPVPDREPDAQHVE